MSFVERQIDLQFTSGGETLTLQGLRCECVINTTGADSAYAQLQMRVFGMTMAQMNLYSSIGTDMVQVQNQEITVLAGDVGGVLSQVFSGTILRSFIDFTGVPDVCFTIAAVAAHFQKATPSAANSYPGAVAAETIIAGLAALAGLAFANPKGAHAILRDQVVSGSVIDQMRVIARNAAFPLTIENKTVTIWPNGGTRDNEIVEIGPTKGLVGYPSYWEAGFSIKSEYNPRVAIGRVVRLTSSLPKANGDWPVQGVMHELSTMTPNGPWFTSIKLCPGHYVANY